ncbi:acetyltransferase [Allopusillimonas ginsengisoli]|uniref:acetyltransferase n=1 Tax=Allopusillimonas ginsengisoli TaxID=453575 RepID=UPI0010217394|nr:acetyltransferase [Allopusillimonas ginsengisoli]TEA79953.1 acetyltransferase [Allopusillimonas ginsengisoli]
MSDSIFAVYGASGFGRQVMPLLRSQLDSMGVDCSKKLFFIDDQCSHSWINGHQVLRYQEFLNYKAYKKYIVIAIANSLIREKLATQCTNDNIAFINVAAANTVILDDVQIGEGSVLSSFSMLTCNIKVGCHFHLNHYSYVAHDCVIGDFVTFAAGVRCSGNVVVGDHVYIGSGAVLKQGTPDNPLIIGNNAVIGMGAIVTKDVPPNVTVVGNPARLLSVG